MSGLSRYLDSIIFRLYGASRLILLPAISGLSITNCKLLPRYCCDDGLLTANYGVGDKMVVVRAVIGSLRRYEVPCMVDVWRMPPLKAFIEEGVFIKKGDSLLVRDWDQYLLMISNSSIARNIVLLIYLLSKYGSLNAHILTKYLDTDFYNSLQTLVLARLLYPRTIELTLPNGLQLNSLLMKYGVGSLFSLNDLINQLTSHGLSIKARLRLLPKHRTTQPRAWVTRYSIPSLIDAVDFKDAVVADIGCGFGVKGVYSLSRGSSFVILLDIDEHVLRSRRSGWAVDRVVATAELLPLRDSSVDVSIFWNVINFVDNKESALREVARITRRAILFSAYNAQSAVWHYDYEDFLLDTHRLGIPIIIKSAGHAQYQALVLINGKNKDRGPEEGVL